MHRNSVLVAGVTALLLGIAGCTSNPTPLATQTSLAPEAPRAVFGAGQGAIQGTIVDDSVLPIPNATLSLLPLAKDAAALATVVSSAAGAFAFSNLAPGDYRLAATAAGFANYTTLVSVQSDKIASTSIVMTNVPSNEPYSLPLIKNRLQTCAHYVAGADLNGLVALRTACNTVYPGGNISYVPVQMPVGHKAAVVEFDWKERTVAASWNIYAIDPTGKTGLLLLATSSAPGAQEFPAVRVQMRSGELAQQYKDSLGTQQTKPVPASDQPFILSSGATYGGDDHQGVRAGFQVEWRYTIYVTVFMNGVPDGLDSYTLRPDG